MLWLQKQTNYKFIIITATKIGWRGREHAAKTHTHNATCNGKDEKLTPILAFIRLMVNHTIHRAQTAEDRNQTGEGEKHSVTSLYSMQSLCTLFDVDCVLNVLESFWFPGHMVIDMLLYNLRVVWICVLENRTQHGYKNSTANLNGLCVKRLTWALALSGLDLFVAFFSHSFFMVFW